MKTDIWQTQRRRWAVQGSSDNMDDPYQFVHTVRQVMRLVNHSLRGVALTFDKIEVILSTQPAELLSKLLKVISWSVVRCMQRQALHLYSNNLCSRTRADGPYYIFIDDFNEH